MEKIMSKHQEHIIAVFADKYNKLAEKRNKGNIYSISELSSKSDVTEAMSKGDVVIAQRADLEENTGFRQLIPYVSLVTSDGKFLAYTRTKQGNEQRLHKKVSVGFGGHMDAADAHFDEDSNLDIQKTIFNGLKREVIEELGDSVYETIKDQINNFQVEELIIDDKTDVEKVHMALLISVVLDSEIHVESTDESITIEGFLTEDEIRKLDGNIEPWSEIVISR
jgi:predicted NUDIX family phosphoesterase